MTNITDNLNHEKTRAKNCIIGALVADAATMGFHWLYSQEKIQALAPEQPEFYSPTAEDYEGLGYFAHGGKVPGEFSHYGEQTLVMLNALVKAQGRFDKPIYQNLFRDHFGYGGEFSGYIDRPTKDTLDNITRFENERLEQANAIVFDGDNQKSLLTKILAATKIKSGDVLREYVEQLAAQEENQSESLSYGLSLVNVLDASDVYHGSDDDQLPAVSKLPPLIASHFHDERLSDLCVSAIQVTNNNTRAIDFGSVSVVLLRELLLGNNRDTAIALGIQSSSADAQSYLKEAQRSDKNLLDLTKEYGLHCNIGCGTVSLLCNLRSSNSFVESIRNNIYAGGDNCGRSIILGAACGILYGVNEENGIPQEWINKIAHSEQILKKIDTLIDSALI